MNTELEAKIISKALEDKKGIDIRIIDIHEISVMADYLIIAGGNNKSQVQAMTDNVQEELLKENIHPNHIEGYSSANWILMDYGDIIVNIFNQDDRLFYDLERLWKDGKEVNLSEI